MVVKSNGKNLASWVSMRTESPHQPGSLTSGLLTSEGEISFGPDVIKPLYVGCICYSSFAGILTNTHTLENCNPNQFL